MILMKASKMLILSALTSVLCLGVAYASFWDVGFEVSSTVNTGDLAIRVESQSISDEAYIQTDIEFALDAEDLANEGFADLKVTKNDLLVTIEDIYPGSKVDYQFDVHNTGSLGILLDDITIQCLPLDKPKKNKREHLKLDKEITTEFSEDGEQYVSLEEFLDATQSDEIANDDVRTYYIRVWFDKDKSLKENQLEEIGAQYRFSINYKQFNAFVETTSSDK